MAASMRSMNRAHHQYSIKIVLNFLTLTENQINFKLQNYLCCFSINFFSEDGVPLNRNCLLASNIFGSNLGFGVALVNTGAIFKGLMGVFSKSSSLTEEKIHILPREHHIINTVQTQ